MNTLFKYKIEPLAFPVDDYRFCVMTYTSVDGGRSYYYCGICKYFITIEAAHAYVKVVSAGVHPNNN